MKEGKGVRFGLRKQMAMLAEEMRANPSNFGEQALVWRNAAILDLYASGLSRQQIRDQYAEAKPAISYQTICRVIREARELIAFRER